MDRENKSMHFTTPTNIKKLALKQGIVFSTNSYGLTCPNKLSTIGELDWSPGFLCSLSQATLQLTICRIRSSVIVTS